MYKVVIIDDEPIIVEGISRLVPWGEISVLRKRLRVQRQGRAGSHKKRETGYYFFGYFHAGT